MSTFGAILGVIVGLQTGPVAAPFTQREPVPSEAASKVSEEQKGQLLRFERQKLALRLPLGWQRLTVVGQPVGLLASFAPLGTSGATLALSYAEDPGRNRLPDNLPTAIFTTLAKRYPGFQQTAKQRVTLAGADAWMLDGQVRPANGSAVVRNRQVYISHQERIYILTLTTKKEDFERLASSLDRLLKSIEWLR